MLATPHGSRVFLALVLLLTFLGTFGPAAAQQPAATATVLGTSPAPTVAPTLAPTAAPTPEPTLTIPQALAQLLSGEKPVATFFTLLAQRPLLLIIGLLLLAIVIRVGLEIGKRWVKRGTDTAARLTGGERRDIKNEVARQKTKEARPTIVADLRYSVLDTTMLKTAAYCLEVL